jgi:hypothetical protein
MIAPASCPLSTGTAIAVAAIAIAAWSGTAFAGKMDALLGDWDLNIAKSKFKPNPPMKKYTMKVIDAGEGRQHISEDGKTFREMDEGKDEKGKQFKNHLLFERP